MIFRVIWRGFQEVPVILIIMGLLYLIGPQIEQDTRYGVTLIVVALALVTVIGFVNGFVTGLRGNNAKNTRH